MAVQFVVERFDLVPQGGRYGLELRRAHIVVRAPHLTDVGVAKFYRTLVGELDETHILVTHRCRNRAPAAPVVEQVVVVAGGRHPLFEVRAVEAFTVVTAVLARVVDALQLGGKGGELVTLGGITRCRCRGAELEPLDGAPR